MIYKRKTRPALWLSMKPKIATLPKPQRIRSVSKHRAGRMVQYRKLAKEFLHAKIRCECDCLNEATQIHHKRGRSGELLNDTKHWLAVCATCHRWIHDHPKAAMELGLLESRL